MRKNGLLQILLVGAALILTVSSCKLGKQYTAPELNLPVAIGGKTDTVCLADQSWQQIYTDSLLQGLVGRALLYNKDRLIAAARIRELGALKKIPTAAMLPLLSGKLDAEREWDKNGGADDTFEAKAVLSWELDLWGNLRWKKERSVAEYLQSVEAARAIEMTLIAEVAATYFELTAYDQELSIVRQTLEARREGVRLAKLRFEGGLTSETSYQQAQVELARTETLVPDLEKKIAVKENDLAFLVGDYPSPIVRDKGSDSCLLPGELPAGLPSELLIRRPDVRQAEQRLIAANAGVGVAFTDMFPRIRLTGEYGFESGGLQDLLKSPLGMISGGLLTPLFEMGKNRSMLKAKEAVYEQECYQYEKTVLLVFKEVANSISNYNKMKEVCESRLKLEQAARSYVELAQLQYINGVINYLDVLDAQRGYLDARIGLSNAVRDQRIALVHLYKALGGGWSR